MRRLRNRSIAPRSTRGAWLSLFAMLMIFIGPLISQSMPMDHHASMSMPASMEMSADSHAHHGSAQAASTAGTSDHALWAKCGYCTLLFSCPALPYVPQLVAATALHNPVFFSAPPLRGHARQTIFPNARSRAPPTLPLA